MNRFAKGSFFSILVVFSFFLGCKTRTLNQASSNNQPVAAKKAFLWNLTNVLQSYSDDEMVAFSFLHFKNADSSFVTKQQFEDESIDGVFSPESYVLFARTNRNANTTVENIECKSNGSSCVVSKGFPVAVSSQDGTLGRILFDGIRKIRPAEAITANTSGQPVFLPIVVDAPFVSNNRVKVAFENVAIGDVKSNLYIFCQKPDLNEYECIVQTAGLN